MNPSTPADAATSVTVHTAQFVAATRYADIPPAALASARKAILDTVGVAIAGTRAEGTAVLRRYVESLACAGDATVFGSRLRVAPRFAALVNGCAMHADDYDDSFPSRLHSSSPVFAAVFAEAERSGASGKDVLAAFCVGTEVTCKVVQAISGEHYMRGFHATGTCGVFGATAGVCNLRGLSADATAAALGIAGSEAAGLRENFGTMVKPLHAGRAAESAIFAAAMVELGFTATRSILEGPRGFFTAGGGGYDAAKILGRYGNPWGYLDPGVVIKPYPSGWLTHPAMCKLEELVTANDIKPEQVERLAIKTHRLMPLNLTYHAPTSGLEGKFSMEFCLASIAVLRRAGLTEFTDAVVNRQDIRDFIAKIDYTVFTDAQAQAQHYTLLTSFLELHLRDGKVIKARIDAARGSPDFPMDEAAVAVKFRDCAQFAGWPQAQTEELIEQLLHLDEVSDVRAIAPLLQAGS